MIATIKIVARSDGMRRVVITRLSVGKFSFEEQERQRVYDAELFPDATDMCWVPLPQDSFSIFASVSDAEREARGRIEWLRTETNE